MTVTTTDEFVSPRRDINRGAYGRPYVVPPRGGKPITYTRCTSYINGIEDSFTLNLWKQRHVAVGVATSDDLAATVRGFDLNDKQGLDRLCDEAQFRAGGHDDREIGTWLHAVTEAADLGQPNPFAIPMPRLSYARPVSNYYADLDAYLEATRPLTNLAIEQFSVFDEFQIGGTADRIVEYEGKKYIADLKTGKRIDLGAQKIAAQLAVYSRSKAYDWRAGEELGDSATPDDAAALRTPYEDVDRERGIVIHLPAGTGTCTLHWIDLVEGWENVKMCRSLKARQKINHRRLLQTFMPTPAESKADTIKKLITACKTKESVRNVWRKHTADWTDDLTDMAKAHISTLLI